jgi:hypothetical protein
MAQVALSINFTDEQDGAHDPASSTTSSRNRRPVQAMAALSMKNPAEGQDDAQPASQGLGKWEKWNHYFETIGYWRGPGNGLTDSAIRFLGEFEQKARRALRPEEQAGLIRWIPGDPFVTVIGNDKRFYATVVLQFCQCRACAKEAREHPVAPTSKDVPEDVPKFTIEKESEQMSKEGKAAAYSLSGGLNLRKDPRKRTAFNAGMDTPEPSRKRGKGKKPAPAAQASEAAESTCLCTYVETIQWFIDRREMDVSSDSTSEENARVDDENNWIPPEMMRGEIQEARARYPVVLNDTLPPDPVWQNQRQDHRDDRIRTWLAVELCRVSEIADMEEEQAATDDSRTLSELSDSSERTIDMSQQQSETEAEQPLQVETEDERTVSQRSGSTVAGRTASHPRQRWLGEDEGPHRFDAVDHVYVLPESQPDSILTPRWLGELVDDGPSPSETIDNNTTPEMADSDSTIDDDDYVQALMRQTEEMSEGDSETYAETSDYEWSEETRFGP